MLSIIELPRNWQPTNQKHGNVVAGEGDGRTERSFLYACFSTGHTQKNGAVLIVFTNKTEPFFCVCPVFIRVRSLGCVLYGTLCIQRFEII
jgi:hypothetical protein